MTSLTDSSQCKALLDHYQEVCTLHMRDLFNENPNRFEQFSVRLGDLLLDYSKNRVTEKTMDLLMELARFARVEESRDRMFAGDKINITEYRPALHVALRNRSNTPIMVDGEDVMPKVNSVLERMRVFTEKVRSGEWRGYNGRRIRSIVNIGIGGSDHVRPQV